MVKLADSKESILGLMEWLEGKHKYVSEFGDTKLSYYNEWGVVDKAYMHHREFRRE